MALVLDEVRAGAHFKKQRCIGEEQKPGDSNDYGDKTITAEITANAIIIISTSFLRGSSSSHIGTRYAPTKCVDVIAITHYANVSHAEALKDTRAIPLAICRVNIPTARAGMSGAHQPPLMVLRM
jgi:hypothetical protein